VRIASGPKSRNSYGRFQACSIFPVVKGPPESIPTVSGPSDPPAHVGISAAHRMLEPDRAVRMNVNVDRAPSLRSAPQSASLVVPLETIRRGSHTATDGKVSPLSAGHDSHGECPRSPLTIPITWIRHYRRCTSGIERALRACEHRPCHFRREGLLPATMPAIRRHTQRVLLHHNGRQSLSPNRTRRPWSYA